MNLIDKAILEWSYKTSKGYPDINSQEDIALFESIFGFIPLLKENKELVDLIKSNITGFGDVSGTGSTNIRLQFSEVPSRGASSTSLRGEIFKELEKLSEKENEITDYKKVKAAGSSVGAAELTFKGKEYKIVIKGTASEDSADTDVKEGLVSLFYVSDITSPFTTENILKRAENLKSIANAGIPGEDSNSSQKVLKYLSALEPKNVHVKFINQPLSSALSIKDKYPEGNIIRSGVFHEIRSKARALTGMNADKWCPGDMYIQLGAIPDFSSYDNIEILNELFLSGTTINLGGATISSDGTGTVSVSAAGVTLPTGSKVGSTTIAKASANGQAVIDVPFFTSAGGLSTAAKTFQFAAAGDSFAYTNSGTFTLAAGSALEAQDITLFKF